MMRLPTFLLFFLLSACSTITINPQAQSGSQIDMNGQRILHAEKGVQLAAKVHDVSVRPSPAEQNYASFWVEVTNKRNVLLPLKFSDFVLLDDQGRQYQATDPAELVDLLTVDASYLLPYPYVGYYYLLDSLRGQADNRFNSESAYYLYFGNSNNPELDKDVRYIKMDGRKIYEFALNNVPVAMKTCLDNSGVDIKDVKKVLIHQANEKMDEAIVKRFYRLYKTPMPEGIMPMSIGKLGNSSVATIPTLFDLIKNNKLENHNFNKGDVIIFASVGAGMHVNAITYRY